MSILVAPNVGQERVFPSSSVFSACIARFPAAARPLDASPRRNSPLESILHASGVTGTVAVVVVPWCRGGLSLRDRAERKASPREVNSARPAPSRRSRPRLRSGAEACGAGEACLGPRATGAAAPSSDDRSLPCRRLVSEPGDPRAALSRAKVGSVGDRSKGPSPTPAHRRPRHVLAVPPRRRAPFAGWGRGRRTGAGNPGGTVSPARQWRRRMTVGREHRPPDAQASVATFRRRRGRREGGGGRRPPAAFFAAVVS